MANKNTYPAEVAKVINEYKLVINRGSIDNVKLDQKFLVYSISDEEVFDPTTKESLGYLEIPKGTGKVIHIQERMATLETDMVETDPIKKLSALSGPYKKPFISVRVGDKVKPV